MIRIPPTDWPRITAILNIDLESLGELLDNLRASAPKGTPEELAATLPVSSIPKEKALEIVEFLTRISAMAERQGWTPLRFLESIGEFVASNPTTKDEWSSSGWEQRKEILAAMISEGSPLYIAGRAIRLARDYPYLYYKAHTLTDVRHVFDSDGLEIKGAIVAHTLAIDYQDEKGKVSTHYLRLNDTDIALLITTLQRTQKKAETIRLSLGNIPDLSGVAG